ncbi:tetratricopeptide repeat protein, partial [candidate division KSB1 bacterium]|nr:tetratricopeptide repeat protein [candidate division KSB1 bacterium]
PEQTLGVEVDHRTDIWSFGVVLFEMLTGEQPFKGDYEQAIIYSILNEDPQSLPNTREDVPAELNKILTKTLQKKPNDRYESMGEILADLNKISTQPKTPSLPQVEKKIPSIAVLPFVNMSADPENEYFSDGLAEDIINALTKIKRFRVAARTSAFSFKGKEVHIREIGRELNVETVLEGSVRKAGTRLRITAQLINVANGYHLWSEQYDRTMDDVFAIQDEITLAIVENLKVELLREEREVLEKRYTENLEAYNLYLKGRHFWNKRNEQGFMKAIDYFQQAIDKDKLYALAYTGLADCYNLIPWYSNFPPKEAYPKAKAAAAKALKIDNSLAESHNSLAWSIMFYDWDWAGAEREFKKAIELNPNYATAHHWYAFYSIYMARFDQSIAEIKRAQEIDPLSLVINEDVGMLFYYARQYDQAIEALQRTIELDSNFSYAHFYLGWVYLQQTKYEKALTEFLKEKELTKAWNPFIETYIGVTYALMGKKSKAQQVLDYLTKTTKGTYISPYLLAILYCAFGKHDESFSWLDKALEDRHILLCFLKVDPVFNNLRSDSRFNELLKKMGLEK